MYEDLRLARPNRVVTTGAYTGHSEDFVLTRDIASCEWEWNQEFPVGTLDDLTVHQLEVAHMQGGNEVILVDIGSGKVGIDVKSGKSSLIQGILNDPLGKPFEQWKTGKTRKFL